MKYRAKVVQYEDGSTKTIFQCKSFWWSPWLDCEINTGMHSERSSTFIVFLDKSKPFILPYKEHPHIINYILKWLESGGNMFIECGELYYGFPVKGSSCKYYAYEHYEEAVTARSNLIEKPKDISNQTIYKIKHNQLKTYNYVGEYLLNKN